MKFAVSVFLTESESIEWLRKIVFAAFAVWAN